MKNENALALSELSKLDYSELTGQEVQELKGLVAEFIGLHHKKCPKCGGDFDDTDEVDGTHIYFCDKCGNNDIPKEWYFDKDGNLIDEISIAQRQNKEQK